MRHRPLLGLLAILPACAAAPHSAAIAELHGTWELAAAISSGARIPTMNVGADGALSGNSGVNRFRGSIDVPALAAGRWQVALQSTTRMAGTQEAMGLEADFLRGLAVANRAVIDGDRLLLLQGDLALVSLARFRLR